ncbi:MAG: hypothetical protein UV57_C0018G0004 [Parcubacteria group bacterium GW2011_GWD2_43_10]|nr:MAG: hypothetical protein UV57_C0018G0004 [Parcubacteria group bacterium GW2011_GWD2_43_10]
MYKAFSGQPKVARADTSHHFFKNLGRVAELVYAYASGAYGRKVVRVQVPPRPPSKSTFTIYQYLSTKILSQSWFD